MPRMFYCVSYVMVLLLIFLARAGSAGEDSQQEKVAIAIVANDDSGWNAVDLVTAQLVGIDNIVLLDRENVKAVAQEKGLALDRLTGQNILSLTTVLYTDLFVVVEKRSASVVIFDAHSGIKIIDANLAGSKLAELVEALKKNILAAVYPFLHPQNSVYLGLLRTRNSGLSKKYEKPLDDFSRALIQSLVSTEGLVVVERDKLSLITKERNLTNKSDDLKSSSYLLYLEAAPDASGSGQIVTVYVLDLQEKQKLSVVVDTPFDQTKRNAGVKNVVQALQTGLISSAKSVEAKQDTDEAKVYFKQYDDLYKQNKFAEALTKIEAAVALDKKNPEYQHLAALCELASKMQNKDCDLVDAGSVCLERLKLVENDFPEYVNDLYNADKNLYMGLYYENGNRTCKNPFYVSCERQISEEILPKDSKGDALRVEKFKNELYKKTISEQRQIFKLKYGFDPETGYEKMWEVVSGDVFKRSRIRLIKNYFQYRADNFMESISDVSGIKRLQINAKYMTRIDAYFLQHPEEEKELSFRDQQACVYCTLRFNSYWSKRNGSEATHKKYLKLYEASSKRMLKSPVFFVRFAGYYRKLLMDVADKQYSEKQGYKDIKKLYVTLEKLINRFHLEKESKTHPDNIFLANLLLNCPFKTKELRDEWISQGLDLVEKTGCSLTDLWKTCIRAERDPKKKVALYKRYCKNIPAPKDVLPDDLWGSFFKSHQVWKAEFLISVKDKISPKEYQELVAEQKDMQQTKIQKIMGLNELAPGVTSPKRNISKYKVGTIKNRLFFLFTADEYSSLYEYKDGKARRILKFKGVPCEAKGSIVEKRPYDLLLGNDENYFVIPLKTKDSTKIALYDSKHEADPEVIINDLPQGGIDSVLIHDSRIFVSISREQEFYLASWDLKGGDKKIHITNTRREKQTSLDGLSGKQLDKIAIQGLCGANDGKIYFTLSGEYYAPAGLYEFDYINSELSQKIFHKSCSYNASYDGRYYFYHWGSVSCYDFKSQDSSVILYNIDKSRDWAKAIQWISYGSTCKHKRKGEPLYPENISYTMRGRLNWPFVFREGCVWLSAIRGDETPEMINMAWPDRRQVFGEFEKPVIIVPDPDDLKSVLAVARNGLFRLTPPQFPDIEISQSENNFKLYWEKCFDMGLTRQKLRSIRYLKLMPEYEPTDEQLAWLFKNCIGICEIWLKGDCYSKLSWDYENIEPLAKITLNGTKLPKAFMDRILNEEIPVIVNK